MLDQAELKKLFFYDPETGLFRRLVDGTGFAKAGDMAGYAAPNGYLRLAIHRKKHALHRLAWLYVTGSWPTGEIDHIDRDRANNRWANLRIVTRSENCQNRDRRGHGNSGRIGVSWDARGQRWMAHICLNYKLVRLGSFRNLIDAVAARMAAERDLFTHLPSA